MSGDLVTNLLEVLQKQSEVLHEVTQVKSDIVSKNVVTSKEGSTFDRKSKSNDPSKLTSNQIRLAKQIAKISTDEEIKSLKSVKKEPIDLKNLLKKMKVHLLLKK